MTRSFPLGVPMILTLLFLIGHGHAGADPLAESESPLRVGERLRITVSTAVSTWNPFRTARSHNEGIYLGSVRGMLALEPKGVVGDTLMIPAGSIVKVEALRGRRSQVLKGAAVGALTGALVGIVAVAATDASAEDRSFGYLFVTPIGAGAGLLVGAAMGFMIRTDHWVAVSGIKYDIGLLPRPEGTPEVVLKVSF